MNTEIDIKVNEIISGMDPISLKEMDHVKLMRRRDTKYVMSLAQLPKLLNDVKDKYRILEIENSRIHPYKTLYYDTPEYEMYHRHHNQRLNRYKVRMRKYMTSDISFLEIKFKNNKRETIKKRIRPNSTSNLNENESAQFLIDNSPYMASEIEPSLQNMFRRITLVHRTTPERITIDLGLEFSDANKNESLELSNVAIVEVKRDRDSQASDMVLQLRDNHIKTMGFSKYCVGTALVKPDVKTNLFKARIKKINRYNKSA